MKLINLLKKECIAPGLQLEGKIEVLSKIVEIAKKSPILKDVSREEILNGLKEREALGSTGFGKGIAIPHCRIKSVSEFVVGIITAPDGADFEALDGEQVKLFVFIIAPDNKSNAHIRLLSAISRALITPGAVEEVLKGETVEAVYESFIRHTVDQIETNGQVKKNLLHIIVQDEEIFRQIIEVLAVTIADSMVFIDAENSEAYLANIPLFAGLWGNDARRFSRIIIAVVNEGLTNETIRSIETVSGDLSKKPGVLVMVQQLSFAAGSLEVNL